MNRFAPTLILLAASTLWGLTWLPLKHFGGYGIDGPIVTLFGHGTVAVVLALPVLWRSFASYAAYPGSAALLAVCGGLANLAFAWAMILGDVTRVMVLFYLLPAWGVLGGWLVLGERIDKQRAASLGFALLGTFFVLGGPGIEASPPSFADLLAVVAGLALAVNNIVFRRLQDVPIPSKLAFNFLGCLLWALLLLVSGVSHVPSGVPASVWAGVSAFGLFWIFAATAGTLWAVHHMEASRSSVLIIMELITAVGSAAVVTGRIPSAIEWCGGALILLSAVLEAWRPFPASAPLPAGPPAEPV